MTYSKFPSINYLDFYSQRLAGVSFGGKDFIKIGETKVRYHPKLMAGSLALLAAGLVLWCAQKPKPKRVAGSRGRDMGRLYKISVPCSGMADGIEKRTVIMSVFEAAGLVDAVDGWGMHLEKGEPVELELFFVRQPPVSLLEHLRKTYPSLSYSIPD